MKGNEKARTNISNRTKPSSELVFDLDPPAPTLIKSVYTKICNLILASGENEIYFGSEDDLLRQLAISRPSLRQVVRLLQFDGLLVVKKGPNGGYFGRVPSFNGVSHLASIYLAANQTGLDKILSASRVTFTELCAQAAQNPAIGEREKLRSYLSCLEKVNLKTPMVVREFISILSEIANNPLLNIYWSISGEYIRRKSDDLSTGDVDTQSILGLLDSVATAVIEGDVEYARLSGTRLHNLLFTGTPSRTEFVKFQ